jgi:hypothetical protein
LLLSALTAPTSKRTSAIFAGECHRTLYVLSSDLPLWTANVTPARVPVPTIV